MNKSVDTELPSYAVYKMKTEEIALTLVLAMGLCFAVGFIFYSNLIISLILSFAGIAYLPLHKKDKIKKRKEILGLQFKDALYFLSVGLSAGKSMEMALLDTEKSLEGIYPDQGSDILKELSIMNRRIMMNEPVEMVFYDLAERSGIEDIKSFADIIMISKRAGANLIEVIRNTSATIREKVEIKNEIANLLAGKKLEQRILMLMPFGLVFILKNSSNFLDPLMNSIEGRIVMTIALIMILFGLYVSKKIMDIEV